MGNLQDMRIVENNRDQVFSKIFVCFFLHRSGPGIEREKSRKKSLGFRRQLRKLARPSLTNYCESSEQNFPGLQNLNLASQKIFI